MDCSLYCQSCHFEMAYLSAIALALFKPEANEKFQCGRATLGNRRGPVRGTGKLQKKRASVAAHMMLPAGASGDCHLADVCRRIPFYPTTNMALLLRHSPAGHSLIKLSPKPTTSGTVTEGPVVNPFTKLWIARPRDERSS